MITMKQMQAAAKWDTGMAKSESEPPVRVQPVVRRFVVSGHAFVPVKVRIEIEAADADAAMRAANRKLKTKIRDHIVAGSDDEGAAWGFDATDAEEIKSPNDKLTHGATP